MTTSLPTTKEVKLRSRWKWFLTLGLILICLGIGGAGAATLLELTSVLIFGPLLLASSIVQLLMIIPLERRSERLMHFAAAIIEMVLGFTIMAQPFVSVVNLVGAIAAFLLVVGIIRLARALEVKSRYRAWFVLTGVIGVLLGVSVWTGWPDRKIWFLGLCIAVDFICHGVSWLGIAMADKNSAQAPGEAPAP